MAELVDALVSNTSELTLVPVRLRLRVLNRKTPDKALFIRGFWFDKVSSNKESLNFQLVFGSSSETL